MISFFKKKPVRDKAYLASYGGVECLIQDHILHVCAYDTVGHHSLQSEFKGMACRAGDDETFACCSVFHAEIHSNGDERYVLRSYGIDPDIIPRCKQDYKDYKNG